MREFRGVTVDAMELLRGLGQLEHLRARARTIDGEDIGGALSANELRAVWVSGKGLKADLPSFLLGSENVLAEFLPRVLALPGVVMPITSQMRAWSIEDFEDGGICDEKPLSNAAALGFVGLIIGELFTTVGFDVDLRLMGMDGVRRTLSFVCAQAVVRGWRHEALAKLVDRWLEASVLTANETKLPAAIQVADMCGFLCAFSESGEHGDSLAQELASQIRAWTRRRSNSSQSDLLRDTLPQVVHELAGVNGREKRYDLIMGALDQSLFDDARHPLERGFLISLIEPGSLEFLDLAYRADSHGGAVAIAYCVCATILGKEASLRSYNGFGWTVLNHGFLLREGTPVDISIAELRVLHNARRTAPIPFRTRSPWLIDVELAPMVIGSFGNVAKRRASSQRVQEQPALSERDELLRERLAAALRALDDAYDLVRGRGPGQDGKASMQRRQRR